MVAEEDMVLGMEVEVDKEMGMEAKGGCRCARTVRHFTMQRSTRCCAAVKVAGCGEERQTRLISGCRVPHPSTNRALWRLTSEVDRDLKR